MSNNKKFDKWMKENKEKCYKIAKANGTYDKNGHLVLSKDDPWRNETEWDEDFKKLEQENREDS